MPVVHDQLAKLESMFGKPNEQGVRKKFIAGTGKMTIADFIIYCEMRNVDFFNIELKDYPNIKRWTTVMDNLSAIKEMHGPDSKYFNETVPFVQTVCQLPPPIRVVLKYAYYGTK